MAPRTKTQQTHHLRVKNLRGALAGKSIQKAAVLALDVYARVLADTCYSRFEDAHRTLGHGAEDKFYDNSVIATTFLDSDLGGNGDRIVMPKDVRPNALSAASVQMMKYGAK